MLDFCLCDDRATKWAHVQGSMSDVVVTLSRVGWHVMDHERWRCHDGSIPWPFDTATWVVKMLLLRATEQWQWQQVAASPGFGHPASGGVLELSLIHISEPTRPEPI
eukprot:8641730-Pyramimonas_sp.AAC.1